MSPVMQVPLLSLITLTKNDASGLNRTLASAAAIRAAGAEHIVIDGSDAKPANGNEHVGDIQHVLRSPKGIADAFNAGIGLARGEWIWCLNGGDEVEGNIRADFLFALLAQSRADVVVGTVRYAGEAHPRAHPQPQFRWPPVHSWIPHPATLVRRALFERFGTFDPRYEIAMDYEWWLRVIPTGVGVDVLSVPLAVFAAGGVSQRAENWPKIQRERRDAMRRHQRKIAGAWAAASAQWIRSSVRALFARPVRKV